MNVNRRRWREGERSLVHHGKSLDGGWPREALSKRKDLSSHSNKERVSLPHTKFQDDSTGAGVDN